LPTHQPQEKKMSESFQIYRTISGLLLSARVRFHDIRCQATFLWAVTGLTKQAC